MKWAERMTTAATTTEKKITTHSFVSHACLHRLAHTHQQTDRSKQNKRNTNTHGKNSIGVCVCVVKRSVKRRNIVSLCERVCTQANKNLSDNKEYTHSHQPCERNKTLEKCSHTKYDYTV